MIGKTTLVIGVIVCAIASAFAQPVGQLPANSVSGRVGTPGPSQPVLITNLWPLLSATDLSRILGSYTTTNVYAGPFPSWLYGVGGVGFPDTQPLRTNNLYLPNGSNALSLQTPYGPMNTAQTLVVNAGSNRPGCVQGLTNPAQSSAYDEWSWSALCSNTDNAPVMWQGTGTFTATTFTPTTPIPQSQFVFAAIGMWIRADDNPNTATDTPAYNGQITSWTVNGSNAITSFTVSNWYQRGGTSGTPAGNYAYLNPQDKLFTHLNTTNLNRVTFTADTSNGSSQLSNVSNVTGVVGNASMISCPGIPDGNVVTNISGSNLFITYAATATATGVTCTASLGTSFNRGVGSEIDLFNAGPSFNPVFITDTGSWIAGSYTVTGLVLTNQWRPGLMVTGSGIGNFNINYVTSVNKATNSLGLYYPTTGTGSTTAIRAQNQLDESGTAIDCLGVVNISQTCFLQRGNIAYGFYSMGASYASFLVRPQPFAGIPLYGFRVDSRESGCPSTAAFSAGTNATDFWKVDCLGNETVQTINSQLISIGTKIRATGTAPTLGSCGTSPTIVGSDLAGEVTMGTGSPTTCVVTFNVAYAAAPFCTVTWQNPPALHTYNVTTTAINIAQTGTSSNKVNYTCVARSGG